MDPSGYRALADLVLLMHVGFVAFMVIGLLLVGLGGMRGWRWVRNPWFRAAHLAGIGLVVLQSWLGVVCPLTTLEMHLRDRAGDATYTGTFMAHWLRKILFYQAPSWVFVVAYALFGLLVLATWITVRPHPFRTLSGSGPRSAA
jgi:polyferredoxin